MKFPLRNCVHRMSMKPGYIMNAGELGLLKWRSQNMPSNKSKSRRESTLLAGWMKWMKRVPYSRMENFFDCFLHGFETFEQYVGVKPPTTWTLKRLEENKNRPCLLSIFILISETHHRFQRKNMFKQWSSCHFTFIPLSNHSETAILNFETIFINVK